MPQLLSLYLDIVRFLAAATVFIGHLGIPSISSGFISRTLEPYGSVAVAVFFVLSGFVIAHVAARRETNATDYAIARLSRLYSVVAIALPVTFLADTIGSSLAPEFYQSRWILAKPVSLQGYAAAAVFVNEWQVFGFHGIEPGSNGPYWSLSFEATYYAVAGVALFARRSIAVAAIPLMLVLAGSTIAALLPLWALGFGLYHLRVPVKGHPAIWLGLAVVAVVGLLCAPALATGLDRWWVDFPWGPAPARRNLAQDYVTGVFFAANVIAVRQLCSAHPSTRTATSIPAAIVRWLGQLTFPLYCFHYPLFALMASNNPFPRATLAGLLFTALGTFAAVALVTPVTVWLNHRMRQDLGRLVGLARRARATDPIV